MTFRVVANGDRNDFSDEEEVRQRHWHIAPGDVVVDVGAGIGSYTLPALAAGAYVFAFAPDGDPTRDTTRILLDNLAANEGFSQSTSVLRCGLSSRSGWMGLCGCSYQFSELEPEDTATRFKVGPLDDFTFERLDWIKIDVEGHELEVLKGAEQTLRAHRPNLLVENHQFMDSTLEGRVTAFVEDLGLGYKAETHPWHSVSHSFFKRPG